MNCETNAVERDPVYDAYVCTFCDEWLEDKCGDEACPYCSSRPAKPSERTGSEVRRASDEGLAASKEKLTRLKGISNAFYDAARAAGVHSFIEHTGLMNEHLNLLRLAAVAGVDPEFVSRHGSAVVPMAGHHAQYLGEKFACIFSPFFTEETWAVFRSVVEADLRRKDGGE